MNVQPQLKPRPPATLADLHDQLAAITEQACHRRRRG